MNILRALQATAVNSEPVARTVRILGSRIHLLPTNKAVDLIERWILARDGRCHQIVATGFHGLIEAHKHPNIHRVLNSAELWVPDGIAPVWLARFRGHRNVVRTPGTEILAEFLVRAQTEGYSSYFYGDTERTLTALCETVTRNYPGNRIVGAYSPPFRLLTPAEESETIDDQRGQARCTLDSSRNAKTRCLDTRAFAPPNVPVAIGVGAAFAFLAGTVSRCPTWMGDAGLEWVYRFFHEPHKLCVRLFFSTDLAFIFQAGLEVLRNRES